MTDRQSESSQFAQEAQARQQGFLGELWQFLAQNKKWWLTPIVIILIAFGLLIALGGTAAAPFIYTLF